MGQVTGNLEVRAEVLRKMICSLLESLGDETRPLLTPVVRLLLQAAFINYFSSLSPDPRGCGRVRYSAGRETELVAGDSEVHRHFGTYQIFTEVL